MCGVEDEWCMCSSVTHLEKKIVRWEGQELLTNADRRSALKIPEKLVEVIKEFNTFHAALIDQTECDEALEEE